MIRQCSHEGRRAGAVRRCLLPEGHGSPLHVYGQLSDESARRTEELRQYARLRADYLAQHPMCESPWNCGQRATEIQHRRGRNGSRLTDVRWFAASCHDCNQKGETHTGEALALGWLLPLVGAVSGFPNPNKQEQRNG